MISKLKTTQGWKYKIKDSSFEQAGSERTEISYYDKNTL